MSAMLTKNVYGQTGQIPADGMPCPELPLEIVERILDEARALEEYERWRAHWSMNVVMMIDVAFSMFHHHRFSVCQDEDVLYDPYHWAFWVPFAEEVQFQAMFCPCCGNYSDTHILFPIEASTQRMLCGCL